MIIGTEFTDNKSPNDPFPAEWGKFSNIFAFIYLVYVVTVIDPKTFSLFFALVTIFL